MKSITGGVKVPLCMMTPQKASAKLKSMHIYNVRFIFLQFQYFH